MAGRYFHTLTGPVSADELGLVRLWIDQGAKGEVHGTGPIVWQPLPEGLNPIYAVALTSDGQFAACARAGAATAAGALLGEDEP